MNWPCLDLPNRPGNECAEYGNPHTHFYELGIFMKQPYLDLPSRLRNECAWDKIWMTSLCSMDGSVQFILLQYDSDFFVFCMSRCTRCRTQARIKSHRMSATIRTLITPLFRTLHRRPSKRLYGMVSLQVHSDGYPKEVFDLFKNQLIRPDLRGFPTSSRSLRV